MQWSCATAILDGQIDLAGSPAIEKQLFYDLKYAAIVTGSAMQRR
jgi:hypothetical protein